MMSSCRRGGMDNDRVVVQVIEIQKRKEKCGFPTPENLILIGCKVRSSILRFASTRLSYHLS